MTIENYEAQFLAVADNILKNGFERKGRNGTTLSLPFQQLKFSLQDSFPLLTTRKMFYKGVLGEYAAMIRGPAHVQDFIDWGCNYWNLWAEEDGSINVDYGNAWRNFNGVDQMAAVVDSLINNPHDRRMVISGWRPDNLEELSLPCCHHNYQFYEHDGIVDLLWIQRSGDWMIGVPSDAVFASVMLMCFADVTGKIPGSITMVIGDAHIYGEHIEAAKQQVQRPIIDTNLKVELKDQADVYSFKPNDLIIEGYKYSDAIKYELKD